MQADCGDMDQHLNLWFLTGFSPRTQNLTLYLMGGVEDYGDILSRLGKHKTGKSCLYINKLEEVAIPVLAKLIGKSVKPHLKPTD